MNDTAPDGHAEPYFEKISTRPTTLPAEGLSLGLMEVGHARVPSGIIFPKMTTHFCVLGWVVRGAISFQGDGWERIAKKGSIITAAKGERLATVSLQDHTEFYYILMDGTPAEDPADTFGLWPGVFRYSNLPAQWLNLAAEQVSHLDRQSTLAATGHSLFINALQNAQQLFPHKATWEACCFIQKNWNRPGLNVEMVLQFLNIPRSTLSPMFKADWGIPILDYIQNLRYQKASQMILSERTPIKEVAVRCGFSGPSYFSSWFKGRSGLSPRELRQTPATKSR